MTVPTPQPDPQLGRQLQAAAILSEYRHTAAKTLPTPVSFIGAFKMIWPLSHGSTGAVSVPRYIGVALLLGIFWAAITTMWYALVFGLILPVGIFWLIFTQQRRHRIHEARNALAGRA
jgi:hypothetical protein